MVKKERCPHRPKLGHRSFTNPATWDCMTIIAYRPIFGKTKWEKKMKITFDLGAAYGN